MLYCYGIHFFLRLATRSDCSLQTQSIYLNLKWKYCEVIFYCTKLHWRIFTAIPHLKIFSIYKIILQMKKLFLLLKYWTWNKVWPLPDLSTSNRPVLLSFVTPYIWDIFNKRSSNNNNNNNNIITNIICESYIYCKIPTTFRIS